MSVSFTVQVNLKRSPFTKLYFITSFLSYKANAHSSLVAKNRRTLKQLANGVQAVNAFQHLVINKYSRAQLIYPNTSLTRKNAAKIQQGTFRNPLHS